MYIGCQAVAHNQPAEAESTSCTLLGEESVSAQSLDRWLLPLKNTFKMCFIVYWWLRIFQNVGHMLIWSAYILCIFRYLIGLARSGSEP